MASAFWHFIENPKVGAVFNMGGGPERSVSLLEAGEMISKATGMPFLHEFGLPHRKGDRLYDVHDVTKFRRDYPYFAYSYSLQDIIGDICS